MKTGFLILNYNSCELSIQLAKTVADYECVDYVIIIDNCSNDNSYESIRMITNPKVIAAKSERNGGYSYGNNYGFRIAQKLGIDIVFLSNPDVYVKEEELDKLIRAFNETDYSILSGIEINADGSIDNPPIWAMPTFTSDLFDCFWMGRKLTGLLMKNHMIDYNNSIQSAFMVKGSFFGAKVKDFLEVGGFDENVFLYCEERILGKKMQQAEKSIGVVKCVNYNHNHRASIVKTYKKKKEQIQILYRSRYYYNKKYQGVKSLGLAILQIAMKISLMEYWIMDTIKGLAGRK